MPLDAFQTAPTLKLRLAWTNQPPQPTVERPRPLQPRDTNQMAAGGKRCSGRAARKEESSSSANSRQWRAGGGGESAHGTVWHPCKMTWLAICPKIHRAKHILSGRFGRRFSVFG